MWRAPLDGIGDDVPVVDVGVLPAFIGVILLFLIPPGPDMAYMVAVGLQGGRPAAAKAILGIGTGMSIYATAVVVGLGQIAESHETLFNGLKLLGSAYLFWLALITIRGAHEELAEKSHIGREHWYRRGLVIALTNPKIMLFFLAVLPHFVGEAENIKLQLAMLGVVNVLSEVFLYGSVGLFAGAFHARFQSKHGSHAALNYVAATVYAGLALVILVEVFAL